MGETLAKRDHHLFCNIHKIHDRDTHPKEGPKSKIKQATPGPAPDDPEAKRIQEITQKAQSDLSGLDTLLDAVSLHMNREGALPYMRDNSAFQAFMAKIAGLSDDMQHMKAHAQDIIIQERNQANSGASSSREPRSQSPPEKPAK